ncbi:MAG: universal stress protein [Thermodesulfovibrionales bacterium]
MKIQRILLSTDGSELSSGAEREAISVARRFNAELRILSVIETNPEFTALAPGVLEKVEEKTRTYLEELRQKAEKEGLKTEIIIHEGEEPFKFIIDEASKRGADLIAMGRRGRKGLTRLMVGSQTARTIGHSSISVLVVPRNARVEFKNIVIATDASRFSEKAAEEAIQIAKQTGASLYAIAVTRPDATSERIKESEDALLRIKTASQKEGVKIEAEHVRNRPHEKIYEAIIEFAKKHNADLIVVGSHGRTGISKLLMGSVAERIIGHSDCAVLVVKA